jgi:hypothetical protein
MLRWAANTRAVVLATTLSAVLVTSVTDADEPTGTPAANRRSVRSLSVLPKTIRLGGANRVQQLLVTARDPSGQEFDVTHRCDVTVADDNVALMRGAMVVGLADGRSELIVRCDTATVRVPVIVDQFETFPPVHFAIDVIPILSKLGCNSGGCHGKQGGKNGFHLSVFGFDPKSDYNALVKEARGRRTFAADPNSSLLLSKATGRLPHGGGRRLDADSADYELLMNWVRQGMPWGEQNVPTLTALRVEPTDRVMLPNADQQILATAIFSDGSERDVTAAATYSSNAVTVAEVGETGRVVTGRLPGEAAVTVNYMGQVTAALVLVPRPNAPRPYPNMPANNRIDTLVSAKLQKMGIVPSALADDATFLRRVSLDTIGTLPTTKEVRKFLADNKPDKRKRVVDRLLDRDEFDDYWALRWADVLLVNRETLGERGAFEFHRWLRKQMADDRPYDQWVRELVTASGSSGRYGPVNFYRALPKPEDAAKAVSQAFLGIRLDCAQCHHHPFDQWGQRDFYGMVGFFNGMQRKPLGQNRELVYHAGFRETKLPLTGEVVPTRPPQGDTPQNLSSGDPRVQLARWMTSRDNPWFARLAANRLWAHFLGRGLIDPIDDLRSTSPATNEPLLIFLTEKVVTSDYNLKQVMRLILNSRVYQLSSEPNATNFDDVQNYSHYMVKRLPAEVLLDAVCQVTDVPETYPGMPRGTRAIALWDNRLPSYFLDTFGRSERQSPCECGKSNEPTMAQALHLMNAPEIEAKLVSPRGRIAALINSNMPRQQLVEALCLSALGRPPGEKERKIADRLFADDTTERQAAEDFLWALLNSYDFLFIH